MLRFVVVQVEPNYNYRFKIINMILDDEHLRFINTVLHMIGNLVRILDRTSSSYQSPSYRNEQTLSYTTQTP